MNIIYKLFIILIVISCTNPNHQQKNKITGLWEITTMTDQIKGLITNKKGEGLVGSHVLIDSNTVTLTSPLEKEEPFYYKKINDTMYFSTSLNGGTVQKVNIKNITNERIEAEFFEGIFFEDSLLIVVKKIKK
jgi:hypothetical protein|tara:strand:+ start:416 stop:814 length:399 start_codon:yes stop_codon:yes gene_type:complete